MLIFADAATHGGRGGGGGGGGGRGCSRGGGRPAPTAEGAAPQAGLNASGKHHLSFCTFSHLINFLLRCDKIKYFMIAFSVLFLLISCRKVSKIFYVLCDKTCDR